MRRTLNASTPTRLATTAAIILLTAAAATFLVDKTEANPPTSEVISHPCAGMPGINLTINPGDIVGAQEIVRRAAAPSGECVLEATVHSTQSPVLDTTPTRDSTCSIQIRSNAGMNGTVSEVSRSGNCKGYHLTTTLMLTAAGSSTALSLHAADASRSATSSNRSIARARVYVDGFLLGGRVESDVRGTWRHTANSVNLISLTYPRLITVEWLTGGPNAPPTQYGISPPSITAANTVRWYDDDSAADLRLKTNATLTMLAGGGYHCSHWAIGYPSLESLGDTSVNGECFP